MPSNVGAILNPTRVLVDEGSLPQVDNAVDTATRAAHWRAESQTGNTLNLFTLSLAPRSGITQICGFDPNRLSITLTSVLPGLGTPPYQGLFLLTSPVLPQVDVNFNGAGPGMQLCDAVRYDFSYQGALYVYNEDSETLMNLAVAIVSVV